MKHAYGGQQRARVVTLDGNVIDTSGTMSGGGNKVALSLFLSFSLSLFLSLSLSLTHSHTHTLSVRHLVWRRQKGARV